MKLKNRVSLVATFMFLFCVMLADNSFGAVARNGSQDIQTHSGQMAVVAGTGLQDDWEYTEADYSITTQASTSEILVGEDDNWTEEVNVSAGHTVKALAGGVTEASIEVSEGWQTVPFRVNVNGTVESKSISDSAILISGRAAVETLIIVNPGGEIDALSSTNYAVQDTGGGDTGFGVIGPADITGSIDLGGGENEVLLRADGGDIEIDGELDAGDGFTTINVDALTNDIELDVINLGNTTSNTVVISADATGNVVIDEINFSAGADTITIDGDTQITNAIDLGAGNDNFTFTFDEDAAISDFTIVAGEGNDDIRITAQGNNNITIDEIDFSDGGSNDLTLTATTRAITLTTLTTNSEADNITFVDAVTVTNGINTGDGNDSINVSGTGFNSGGAIQLGAGNDTFIYDSDQNVDVDAGTGDDNFQFNSDSAAYSITNLDLSSGGNNDIEIDGTTNVITITGITCGDGDEEIEAEGATVFNVGNIDLAGGDDEFTFTSETSGSIDNQTILTGTGSNVVNLDATTSNIANLSIDLTGDGSNEINLNHTGTGSITVTTITCADGSDNIDVRGNTTITNAIDLLGGDDTFKFTSEDGATIGAFTITSGSGNDLIDITAAGGNNRTVTLIDLSGGGTNTVNLDTDSTSTLTVNGITCGADNDTIDIDGDTDVAGAIALGTGDDTLTFTSEDGATIAGAITGGAGIDTFNIESDTNAISVNLDAGAGDDVINFTLDGANTTITALTLGAGDDQVTITGDGITAADSNYIQNIDLSASAGDNSLTLDNVYLNGSATLGAGNSLYSKSSSYINGALTAAGVGNTVRVGSSSNLTVAGAVSLTDTEFKVAINDTISGKITATAGNNITLAGTSVVTPTVSGYVEDKARYTILETSGAGAVVGTFSSLNFNAEGLFLDFSLDYSANTVELVAARTPYTGVQLATPNQTSIAANLQVAARGSSGDMREIFDQIDQIKTVQSFQVALDQLSPEVYSGNIDSNFAVTSAYNSGMAARMGEVRADAGRLGSVVRRRVPYGPGGPSGTYDEEEELISGIWAKPFYTWADLDGSDGHMGFTCDSYGVMAGYDRRYGNVLLGVSAGYAGSNVDYSDGVSARTDLDTYHLGVYGSYSLGRLYFDSGLSVAVNDGTTERMIRIGTVDRTANGDTEGETYTSFLTAGYNYAFKDWVITPKATLQGSRFHQQGFKETWNSGGVGKEIAGMNLKVDSSTSSSFQSILGLNVGRALEFKGMKLRPELRAAWMHEYVDTERKVKARFANAPTSAGTFTVEGMKPESDSYGGGLGVTAYLENKELFFNFDTEVRGEFTSSTISGGMRFEF